MLLLCLNTYPEFSKKLQFDKTSLRNGGTQSSFETYLNLELNTFCDFFYAFEY